MQASNKARKYNSKFLGVEAEMRRRGLHTRMRMHTFGSWEQARKVGTDEVRAKVETWSRLCSVFSA